jgi:hypothetical protein
MLASITPLGERGRHSHFAVTVTAFALGATVAGALLGAVLGTLGSLLPGGFSDAARALLAAAVVLVAVALDLQRAPRPAPGPRRQVDERWLDRYRGWVYGLGYGSQLGVGVATVITSAATYAALVCAVLSGTALGGAVIVGVYGAVRGLTPLLTARVHTPAQLMALHARLTRAEAPLARAGAGVLVAAALGGLVAGLW